MEQWPEGWTEEDVLRNLSPPQPETPTELPPDEAKRARERDRKREQRAKQKQPREGSNELVDPPLAPLAYRQKVAAIRSKIGLAHLMSYADLEKVETFLDCMLTGWESDEWACIEGDLQLWGRTGRRRTEVRRTEEGQAPAPAES
jgi:hypothetical protein